MKIAVFGCSNGLGHVRRIIAITCQLFRLGFKGEITAYLPKSHIQHMKKWHECTLFVSNKNIKIIDFCYPRLPQSKTEAIYDKNWNEIVIPDLSQYDLVWSDNITQIVGLREDTILTGTFLWYDVFSRYTANNKIDNFVLEQRNIVRSIKPTMISNDYFATPEVRNYTRYHPVGLYQYNSEVLSKKLKNDNIYCDVLFACGLGGEEEGITREALKKIISKYEKMNFTLWVEPRILPEEYPDWIKKANFSSDLYRRCKAAIIRPGIGTLSDVLAHSGRPFTFYNNANYEMSHNASVLVNKELGEICDDPMSAFEKSLEYIEDKKKISNQHRLCNNLSMEGVPETAKAILQHT
jgi:hypothetical protein